MRLVTDDLPRSRELETLSPVVFARDAFAFDDSVFAYHEDPTERIQRAPLMRRYGRDTDSTLIERMVSDQRGFYSRDSLTLLAGGFAIGGLMANTSIDQTIHSHIHTSIVHASSDVWFNTSHANKELGNGKYTLPVFAGAWMVGSMLPESQFSDASRTWGERTLRAFVVGAPPVIFLQHATGGSRPDETEHTSHWRPWTDNNGVSGHAFMGSLPFITAAKMTDSIAWKTTFYAASTLAPLSRASDSAHYPSQVALGWWISYLAASSIHATDNPNARWRVYPTTIGTGNGMAIEYRF